jgi:HTH-type transcriptional regulator, sugar sensing transcriptional regulator
MISYQQLEQFGLTGKEAGVYLANLELGAGSVQNIAKRAGIHRVSTYDILRSLMEKGVVRQVAKGKKIYYSALEPQFFLERLKNKANAFSQIIPELQAIRYKGPNKIKVTYHEGEDSVMEAYLDRIRHATGQK